VREQTLELVPVSLGEVDEARGAVDVLLERVPFGTTPPGTRDDAAQSRLGLRLYEEGVALVLPADHELAAQGEIGIDDLALLTLLDHPDHLAKWPAAEPWRDESWMPRDAEGTLELVATGAGAALMSFPLARHLASKRRHAVIPVAENHQSLLPGTEIWATWRTERDGDDVQRLIGVLRGRGPRSSR